MPDDFDRAETKERLAGIGWLICAGVRGCVEANYGYKAKKSVPKR